MIKVGIVGGTGYTGVELLRLLAQHPQAEALPCVCLSSVLCLSRLVLRFFVYRPDHPS